MQGCAGGRRGACRPPVLSTFAESWSKVSHAAKELATAFYVIFVVKIFVSILLFKVY